MTTPNEYSDHWELWAISPTGEYTIRLPKPESDTHVFNLDGMSKTESVEKGERYVTYTEPKLGGHDNP